jgi:predicted component of type VI protein secretion system
LRLAIDMNNMGLWFYGKAPAMKTTVEVPDDLYRRAKAQAALQGRKLKDLVEEGLRRVLEVPAETKQRPRLAALMKGARGIVDSGVPDLASNPEYLTSFGRHARRHR